MKVDYRQSFIKDIQKLGNATIRKRVQSITDAVKSAENWEDIAGVKKSRGIADTIEFGSRITG